MNKKCGKCGVEKDVSEFGKDKNKKDGLCSWCKSCQKEYYKQNRDDILEQRKEYRQTNKNKICEYRKERLKNDPEFRLKHNIQRQVNHALKRNSLPKTSRTAQFVDVKAINEHLGPRPEGYHLDHIIPLSKFDPSNLEHLKLAFLPQNLRYIHATENCSKGDTIVPELITSCPILTEIAQKIGIL